MGDGIRDFRQLEAWRRAHRLALDVYRATAPFPREEQYGLSGQMRRSAISIPSNIAEGCGRGGSAELARFLRIARGSASELEYQLQIAHELGFLADDDHRRLSVEAVEVRRMLAAYMDRIQHGAGGEGNNRTQRDGVQ